MYRTEEGSNAALGSAAWPSQSTGLRHRFSAGTRRPVLPSVLPSSIEIEGEESNSRNGGRLQFIGYFAETGYEICKTGHDREVQNLKREDYGLEHAGIQGPDEAQLAPGLDPAEDDVHEARGEGLPDVHDARALDGGSLRPVT